MRGRGPQIRPCPCLAGSRTGIGNANNETRNGHTPNTGGGPQQTQQTQHMMGVPEGPTLTESNTPPQQNVAGAKTVWKPRNILAQNKRTERVRFASTD